MSDRGRLSRSKLCDFKEWLSTQADEVPRKSAMGNAIGYTLNNWEALVRYVEDGALKIDNNPAERALRGIAVGRKNWLFTGSDNGGGIAAVLFSLIASAKRHNSDSFTYLRDVIQ